MQTLYISGYTGNAAGDQALDKNFHFLQKPFEAGALAQTVRRLLDAAME